MPTAPTTTTSGACRCTTTACSSSSCCSKARRPASRGRPILNKRDGYRAAFAGFDPARVARFDAARCRAAGGRRRHRAQPRQDRLRPSATPARSSRCSASSAASTPSSGRSSTAGRGRTRGGRSTRSRRRRPQSDALSKDLARRGFRFVGSTIVYAFMQATGLVNDHLVTCPRWRALGGRPRRALKGCRGYCASVASVREWKSRRHSTARISSVGASEAASARRTSRAPRSRSSTPGCRR